MKYRCPKCACSDLRAEVPCVVTLNGNGTLELESFDAIPYSTEGLIEKAYRECWVVYIECEHEDYLPKFEDLQPKG